MRTVEAPRYMKVLGFKWFGGCRTPAKQVDTCITGTCHCTETVVLNSTFFNIEGRFYTIFLRQGAGKGLVGKVNVEFGFCRFIRMVIPLDRRADTGFP